MLSNHALLSTGKNDDVCLTLHGLVHNKNLFKFVNTKHPSEIITIYISRCTPGRYVATPERSFSIFLNRYK